MDADIPVETPQDTKPENAKKKQKIVKNVVAFWTSNDNKFREAKAVLDCVCIFKQCKRKTSPEIQGDIVDIIFEKGASAAEMTKEEAGILVEDTSLECECLGGQPGPYVKYWDPVKLAKAVLAFESHRAKMIIAVSYRDYQSELPFIASVPVHGTIVSPRGSNGFGFDTIFQPDGSDKTFAEMSADEKQTFSPRAKALQKVIDYMKTEKH